MQTDRQIPPCTFVYFHVHSSCSYHVLSITAGLYSTISLNYRPHHHPSPVSATCPAANPPIIHYHGAISHFATPSLWRPSTLQDVGSDLHGTRGQNQTVNCRNRLRRSNISQYQLQYHVATAPPPNRMLILAELGMPLPECMTMQV